MRGILYPILGTLFGGLGGSATACALVWQACSDPNHDCGSPGLGLYMYVPPLAIIGVFLGALVGTIVGFIKNRRGSLS